MIIWVIKNGGAPSGRGGFVVSDMASICIGMSNTPKMSTATTVVVPLQANNNLTDTVVMDANRTENKWRQR